MTLNSLQFSLPTTFHVLLQILFVCLLQVLLLQSWHNSLDISCGLLAISHKYSFAHCCTPSKQVSPKDRSFPKLWGTALSLCRFVNMKNWSQPACTSPHSCLHITSCLPPDTCFLRKRAELFLANKSKCHCGLGERIIGALIFLGGWWICLIWRLCKKKGFFFCCRNVKADFDHMLHPLTAWTR